MRKRWWQLSLAAVLVAGAAAFAVVRTEASTGSPDPVVVGTTTTRSWSGQIPPSSVHPTNTCNGPGTPTSDVYTIDIVPPANGYADITATFAFTITWNPSSGNEETNDEILTVNRHAEDRGDTEAQEVGSSDSSATSETVVGHNLAGVYDIVTCGFNSLTAQDYSGTLTVTTAPLSSEAAVPSDAPAAGLAFSSATTADPQRDEAEPLIEISRDGHIYTCGPTGFSNGVDYAQVSTDHGDQFHILGTQPRGQHAAGGGGDCALATATAPTNGHYQYAYAGLGALSGFATATSADDGHSLATGGGDLTGGATTAGVLADRQWQVFTGPQTVLLSWNQQFPRNTVVVKSTDGGLTYDLTGRIAAPDPEFPGPMRYITSSNIVYMPWTKGEQVNLAISRDGGDTWTDCAVATGPSVRGGTAGFAAADHDAAGNIYIAWSDSDRYHVWLSKLTADKVTQCNQSIAAVTATDDGQPAVVNGMFTAPVQVDRDAVRTTVFPWVAAGGASDRVAVAFYGTTADGDPNVGTFDAAWGVYVSQSVDGGAHFAQVKATQHPFHYDSICLNGLGCDISGGDRSLADFFAIANNPDDGRLYIVFNRTNKQPDEALGRVATPMVVSQIAGPSNNGGTVAVSGRDVVRSSSADPTGDAQSNYSITAPAVAPANTLSKNEDAADFTSASVGTAPNGDLTVTMSLADLSAAALNQAKVDTGGQSLEWVFRFTSGHLDGGASAAWNPVTGWSYGYDRYQTGGSPCETATAPGGDKCVVYPQSQRVDGSVDGNTITLTVPASLLKQLSGADAAGRPLEAAAAPGARFYDGAAFSFANTTSPDQAQQTFLYTLDSTAPFDFLLGSPVATGGTTGGGGGSTAGGGGGGGAATTTTGATPVSPPAVAPAAPPAVQRVTGAQVATHLVRANVTIRASARTPRGSLRVDLRKGPLGKVVYSEGRALRFHSLRLTAVRVSGGTATLTGTGVRNGARVPFTVVLSAKRVQLALGGLTRKAQIVAGTVTVR